MGWVSRVDLALGEVTVTWECYEENRKSSVRTGVDCGRDGRVCKTLPKANL